MKICTMRTFGALDVIKGTKTGKQTKSGTMLKNERYSFQVAYKTAYTTILCSLELESDISSYVTLREERLAPCSMTVTDKGYVLSHEPTMYPDILAPYENIGITCRKELWQATWVTVTGNPPVGVHKLKFRLKNRDGKVLAETSFTLEVLNGELEQSDLIYTNWFHYDGISRIYNEAPFTDKYNEILEKYVSAAVVHGMNMLYMPVFTPPLDTQIGGERLTVQLVGMKKEGSRYSFDFSKLEKFVALAHKCGIKYFEVAHLFTQWGAKCTPKIVVETDGEEKKLFGWHVASDSPEYDEFLSQFLPALKECLQKLGIYEKCYFHVSDEPSEYVLESYAKARALLEKYLPDCKSIEALSHYEFYRLGYVKTPVVSTKAFSAFANVKGVWAYTCCTEKQNNLANRFMCFPPQRNRILGIQLYLNECVGYLHWGYNFYNSYESRMAIDPFEITDACGAFESGDSFIVYPGKDGPLDSARHEVFSDGMQDYRALKTLEKRIGRKEVEKMLYAEGFEKNFTTYPMSASWHLAFREKLNRMIAEK